MRFDLLSDDWQPKPRFRLNHPGVSLPAFQALGYLGLAAAILLAMTLVRHAGLSYQVMSATIAAAIAAFLALVMATKIVTGEERITYYHHQIAVLLTVALLLRPIHRPLLPYLDIAALGMGTFLAFGRAGCLMAGCCHGRPYRWGVRYNEEHAAAGFPSYLVGVRLFPIQAIESLWVLGAVSLATYLAWSGRRPGTALACYVVTYGSGRFVFEFARGDAVRPYWLGFSQPQWISLLLTGGISWAEMAGILPAERWHPAAFGLLATSMIVAAGTRHFRRPCRFDLLHPRHTKQIAEAMRSVCVASGNAMPEPGEARRAIAVACTSLGIQLSGCEICRGTEQICHYTLSGREEALTADAAKALAALIARLKGSDGPEELARHRGIFHVLIRAPLGTKLMMRDVEQRREGVGPAGGAARGLALVEAALGSRGAALTAAGKASTAISAFAAAERGSR
jgi:prolipoprotein diacylglyceryltransferase